MEKLNKKEVKNWLEKVVEEAKSGSDATLYSFKLSDGLIIAVYWCGGYGEEKRDDIIQDGDYGLEVAIKIDNPAEYDGVFLNLPIDENGDYLCESMSFTPSRKNDIDLIVERLEKDYALVQKIGYVN